MSERGKLKRLAIRVARGQEVAWSEEERAALTEEERAAIRHLRLIAAVAAFNESVQSEDADPDLLTSVTLARTVAGDRPVFADAEREEPALSPGTRWSHLEILELIGRGAFGAVYRARDTRLDRIVALKILAGEPPTSQDEVVREARLLARVRHSNVVTVYGADRIGGRVGIWMEYVPGETLNHILKERGVLGAREAALIGIDLCRALSAVHAAGLVHRDVKLANVMRAEGGRIVLMDFGLGRETPRSRVPRPRAPGLSGTPLFMAPEVLRGGQEDARSDVYSLGVVLFALVTGKLPVGAPSLPDLQARHERREIRRAGDLRADLPESFGLVLDRALDPDPSTRFHTAGEAEKALLTSLGATVASAAENRGTAGRWLLPATIAGGLLILFAMMSLSRWGRPANSAPEAVARAPFPEIPDLTLLGEDSLGLFGLSVAGVGDVDKDGFDDVLVASPLHNFGGPNAGKVYLYRGGRGGLDPKPSWTYELPEPGLNLGFDVASFTTLKQGGFPALVVGAPGSRDPSARDGRVLVFGGSRSGPSRTPVQVLHSDTPMTGFGYSLSSGDVNHDGKDDLLVGEPSYPGVPSGRALLFMAEGDSFASRPVWTYSGSDSSLFGWNVSLGGDVNNDGYGDAAIGAPASEFGGRGKESGAVYVFLGSATGLDTIPIIIPGRQAGARFGHDAFFAGDLDADGFEDLFIGSEYGSNGENGEGIGEIYFGSPNGPSIYGASLLESNVMGANFGAQGAPLGDVDGDGCDDIFVGALRYQRTEPRAGAAFIFSGSRRRVIQRSWFRVGPRGGTWLGAAGCGAGDVNGDGFPDFVLGGPSWDTDAGENTGMVEVYLNTRRR